MKKMVVFAMAAIMGAACIAGCGKTTEAVNENRSGNENGAGNENRAGNGTEMEMEKYPGEDIADVQLFPTLDASYVGDPMPYYENGTFHVFYLEDARDGKTGYHPWALLETEHFYEYEDQGVVIPYADSMEEQDIALGTGSVIKDKGGLYHAFYTGHNDTYKPKEAVMHATSTDMIHWTKLPEHTFYAGEHYSKDDFRDPYVLYVTEEEQYWMLVSTRSGDKGILAKYTSKDLITWKDEGIFFENDMGTDSNLECSTLIPYQGKWYLSFSDQWPDRQFHYRVSSSIHGPFEIPAQDVIDGNGFYAGRLESDGENMYAFGWNGTKNQHMDSEAYNWGGNLVVHQLSQTENGELVPVVNTQVKEKMNHELSFKPVKMTESIKMENSNYVFSGNSYESVIFNELLGSYLLECTIKDFKNSGLFGFAFYADENGIGNLNIVFNTRENKVEFYNTDEMEEQNPQSDVEMDFANADELNVTMLIADGIVSVYVNDQCALTARMYASQGTTWGIFGMDSDMRCENVRIYK